jgi:tetratricopeptide (TPR) repeat protein/DNA-binding SARP family transcriptional activator/DNA-binding transcriptional regulator YiaG
MAAADARQEPAIFNRQIGQPQATARPCGEIVDDQTSSLFGMAVRRHRLAAGLTQHELAQRSGFSVRGLRDLEQGRTRQPHARSVRRLADALALSPAERERLLALLTETNSGHRQLHVGVLGPLVVVHGGAPVNISSPRQHTLLGLLALHRGQTVPTSEIIDVLWDEDPPRTARNLVQMYVGQLRALLGTGGRSLRSAQGGYALDLAEQQLDLAQFDELVRRAHAAQSADQPDRATQLYTQALGYWRGPVLADAAGPARRHPTAVAASHRRIAATIAFADVALAIGAGDQVLATLRSLSHQEPLHEAVHARLMLALATTGEKAGALRVYADLRARLADELGVEPGPEIQAIHLRILRGQPYDHTGSARKDPSRSMPRQLPVPPQAFTGRAAELSDLEEIHDASTVVITAIDGMAGVGKTALAVQAAHQMVDRYPDGQLFLDLHGYTHGIVPMEPGEALERMLRALGVAGERIPADLDERAGLYRSRLADQRMLIVLDNAATETQVTPLLPGAPGCLVLVTSRRRLAGLDHTHTLSLDILPPADAVMLLRHTVGESRVAGQPPDLVAELVELCGRLPLAIRIAAARLRSHPTWDLAHLLRRLRHQQHRLVELAAGQRSVTAALDLSYQDLSADQQRTYRRLGLHPGPDIEPCAAAALLGSTLLEAGQLLEQLLEANLLQEPVPGRYRFHDLTRAHAASSATRDETERGRRAALDRLLDYYRHTASVAADAGYPYERERRPQVPPARTPSPALGDPAPALSWLDSELPNLLAATVYATEHSRSEHVLHLSTILRPHLRTRGPYHQAVTLHRQALTIARAAGHHAAQLEALIGLGHIHRLQGRHELATDHYQQALQLARTTGHRPGELDALAGLGRVHMRQGRYEQATDHLQQALQLARATGHRPGELDAMTGLGRIHLRQGRLEQATDHLQQALQLARATGHHTGKMDALTGLGHVHMRQGRLELATDHYQQALQLARITGHHTGEQNALTGLGRVHLRQRRYEQAADHYQQALQLARATGQHTGEQNALTGLGRVHLRQRRYEQATNQYQRLLNLADESGDRNFEFEAWQGIGRLQHATGHPDAALTYHRQALALAEELGQPGDQARAHDGLAHAHHALHQPEQARTHWQHALDILTSLGVDHTDEEETSVAAIRTHLTNLGHHERTAPAE